MTKDLKLGATYRVVTPYCVYSALVLRMRFDNELEFHDLNSEDYDCITIPAKHIDAIINLGADDEPEFDSAGFSIADRFGDDEEGSHHCDDLDCNCSF
jgi:hypothetical protein